jgi:integrase
MQSTKCTDKRDALVKLQEIMAPFVYGDETVVLENLAAKIGGRKAEEIRFAEAKNPPLTLARAWISYVTAQGRPDSGERTLSDYEGYFKAFNAWLAKMHPKVSALRDVTPAIASEYASHLTSERGLSSNSYNKHSFFLTLLFRVLKKPARLVENPWDEITRKRVVSQSRRELTIQELQDVCAAATGEMRLLFAIGIYTGLRLGDAATLRWGEVDLHQRLIRRIPSKVARRKPQPVLIPIHPALGAMLAEQANVPGRGEYVMPETAVQYLQDTSVMSKRIHMHFENCKVTTQRPDTGKGTGKRAIVEVGFHSLRHTFVSMCRQANAPLSVVEAIVGHSNPAMTRHYTHVGELAAAAAVDALPSVLEGAGEARALPAGEPVVSGPWAVGSTLAEKVKALAVRLNGKNWKAVQAEMLALAEA